MKNRQAILQDNNISRYSYASIEKQPIDISYDSVDKMASEILKERAERLACNEQEMHQEGRHVKTSEEAARMGYQVREITEIIPISKPQSELLNQLSLQKSAALEGLANGTPKEKISMNEWHRDGQLEKGSSPFSNKVNIVIEEHRREDKAKQNLSGSSSKIEYQRQKRLQLKIQQSQGTQLQSYLEKHQLNEHKHKKEHKFHKSEIRFQETKADRVTSESIHAHEKEAKIEAPRVISEPVSDQIYFGVGKTHHPKSQLRENQACPQNDNIKQALCQKDAEGLNAAESKISRKESEVLVQEGTKQQKSYEQLGEKNETDREVVDALNDRLNQINSIQEAEINEAISKRISSERNQSSANFQTLITAPPDRKNEDQANFVSQLATGYSDDLRDYNILEHHLSSNATVLQKQIQELLDLHAGLIMQEECKQLRRKVKDAQMQNRKYRIQLRNASYAKRFNFHSPIPRNNNRPLDFYEKFTVSQNLAAQYYQTAKRITDEKKQLARFQEQYKVICSFQELMRNELISSYPPLPFDLEYDSELGKYKATKINFIKQSSGKELTSNSRVKHYEFDKSKRTLKLQEEEINYYDLLNYKRDICRDTIEEYQVFNLGRIEKLKDENKLISREIWFINQRIEEVSQHSKAHMDQTDGPSQLPKSQYLVTSKHSFTRSPQVKSTTRLLQVASPMKLRNPSSQAKIQTNKRISLTKTPEIVALEKKKQAKVQVTKPSMIAQINDEYGLSAVKGIKKQAQQIPTFGKTQSEKMILKRLGEQRRRIGSPMVRRVNYIKVNRDLLARTELNIKASRSKDKLMSEQISPIKKTKLSFSVSQEMNV